MSRAFIEQSVNGMVFVNDWALSAYEVLSGRVYRVDYYGTPQHTPVGPALQTGGELYATVSTLKSVIRREYRAMRRAEGR